MKKKIIVLIIIAFIFITGCVKEKNDNSNKEKSLIAVVAKYNIKSAATFDGIAIFDDGSIYTNYYSALKKEYNSYLGSYSINTKSGFQKFFLEKGMENKKVVSKNDLKKIKNNIKKLNKEDNKCRDDDETYSNLVVYKNDEIIKYSISGECDVTESNELVKEIVTIINEYKKK